MSRQSLRANVRDAFAVATAGASGNRGPKKLGQVLAAAPRKIILDFDLARASGKTLTRTRRVSSLCAAIAVICERERNCRL
jgi:hypothetical protein